MPRLYMPLSDSLAARVVNFFADNPDEHLSAHDIAVKFVCTRTSVHTLLRPAVEAGHLTRSADDEHGFVYGRGHGKHLQDLRRPPGAAAPINIDIDALQVDDDIPYIDPNQQRAGHSKWDALFAKLQAPGQSIAIPGNARGAVKVAAAQINKTGKQGKYRVATVPGGARVWRVE